MTDENFSWPLVSALFVTYKRIDKLEKAIAAFRKNTDYPNLEIVITDDGSPPDIQEKMRQLPADVFALMPKNRGLGANNNNGMKHSSGKYILMIQDDWVCQGPPEYLRETVRVMEANPRVGIINFGGAAHPPDLGWRLEGSEEPCFVTPEPLAHSVIEQFLYSDQPHIRRREVNELIGLYIEDRNMEKCEIDYNHRWKEQKLFLTAVFPAYHRKTYFDGGENSPDSFRRNLLRYRVMRRLQPVKRWVPKPVTGIARKIALWPVYLLEWLRITR